jgi:hypothetical protein
MRWTLFFVLAAAVFAADGFQPLFNGRNLDGWDGDPRLWSVRNGMIVGSTENVKIDKNQFLITKNSYRNFVLRAQVKLRNHNSGIQFRSEARPGWVVAGYQADMAENNYWGCIYDEKGTRGILVNGWKDKAEKVVRLQDWNDYEITAEGDQITVKLNGVVTAELKDSARLEGVIAFQLHTGPPMEAYFRNVMIKVLP